MDDIKSASDALKELLHNSERFYVADLYTITMTSSMVLRYTSHDMDITVDGQLFQSFPIDRSTTRQTAGLDVDEMTITILATQDDTIAAGVSLFHAMRSKAFHNAILKLDRVFSPIPWQFPMPPISADYVLDSHFLGRMIIDQIGGLKATITVRSMTELLNAKQPRNIVQPSCIHTVYDSECELDITDFLVNGTVGASSTKSLVLANLPQSSGYFDMGALLFTSGLNMNVQRSVREYTRGRFLLTQPLPYTPAAGDTFTALPGCDRSKATCAGKFNNLNNFRGYPYVPTPETVL